MVGEAKKLHLIEEIIKIENDELLNELESAIMRNRQPAKPEGRFGKFAGMWTDEEADEFERIIEEGCETIHPDDWK
jgi:hypothetical protein